MRTCYSCYFINKKRNQYTITIYIYILYYWSENTVAYQGPNMLSTKHKLMLWQKPGSLHDLHHWSFEHGLPDLLPPSLAHRILFAVNMESL